MYRAYYSARIKDYLEENPLTILGRLADRYEFELDDMQKMAWKVQIDLLKLALIDITGHIFFEFSIPRMGKRVDVIILANGIVFVLEFKVGESNYPAHALEQVMDYALDLKNFHETSHTLPIVPILVATNAKDMPNVLLNYPDGVYQPQKANSKSLANLIRICIQNLPHFSIESSEWEVGRYKPTPTIIDAAQALYRGHNVHEISRSDAGAINLSETSECIDRIIEKTKHDRRKAICFITGVPGSGKTLAGLNIANRRLKMGEDEHAVFLSGNGPLVKVLREALVRDEISKGFERKDTTRKVGAFIQNIHKFRDESVIRAEAPLERVVIFDEAQRAWTKEKLTSFMDQKRGQVNFDMSEPEFLIRVMDRHNDWAVIICLIGGGQEIYTGEAGLTEWFSTLQEYFPAWRIYVSPNISDFEYLMGKKPGDLISTNPLIFEDRLHLAVSLRSYRSENVSALVKSILDCDLPVAKSLYTQVAPTYPICLTRNLQVAKEWLRQHARGSERFGLLASSGAIRLRPEGIFVKDDIEVEHWFLDDKNDVRSSFALEGVATEFDIQGLELDWACIAWDADFRYLNGSWDFKSFKGSLWQSNNNFTRQLYLKNSYRVLLTRARQGMVIFVPKGDEADQTRLPAFYNGTFSFLHQVGFQMI